MGDDGLINDFSRHSVRPVFRKTALTSLRAPW